MGLMLETGEGLPPDAPRAVTLYERACTAGGLAIACTNLGRMFASGVGVDPDSVRAMELFEVACSAGEKLACSLRGPEPLPRSEEEDRPATAERGRLVGRVVDPTTGDGLPNVSITLADGPGALSDEDGRFVMGDISAGSSEVTFQRLGYDQRSVIVEIESGRTVALEVSMSTGRDRRRRVRSGSLREWTAHASPVRPESHSDSAD